MSIDHVMRICKMILTKTQNLVKRGYVSLLDQDDKNVPHNQVSYLGKTGISERISPYGLYANLPKDTQVLLFSVCGDEANLAHIGYSQDKRFKNLKNGEVLVGNPQTQSYVKFDADGNIEVEAKGKLIINVSGDAEIKANNVKIDAAKVDLGVGGKAIARQGDSITTGGTIVATSVNTSL